MNWNHLRSVNFPMPKKFLLITFMGEAGLALTKLTTFCKFFLGSSLTYRVFSDVTN